MTQDDYKLFTGEDASQYSVSDWSRIVAIASSRLASFLCLPNGLPTTLPDDLKMLLANFIAYILRFEGSGSGEVESKHVRNFTINFKTTTVTNAFAGIAKDYADIVENYSNCSDGFKVESTAYYGCNKGCACHE